MKRITLSAMILGLLLLCFSGVLFASVAGELRDHAKVLLKEASVMAEQGNKEISGRLESESVWLIEAAERQGDRPDIAAASELRERAKAVRKESSVMAERGNKELVRRLESEIAWLLEAAERLELTAKERGEKGNRPGIEKEVRHLKERLGDLLAKERQMREAKAPEQELAEMREQISSTERELKQIQAHHAERAELSPKFRAQAEKLEFTSRRIHHIRVAAENLKKAEVHDLAHQLMEKADVMEREVQEAKQRLAAEMHEAHDRQGGHGPDVMQEMRAEIERLRAEVNELRQKIEKR